MRYLTSLGCKKDSAGFSELTPEDIRMIEDGYTNYIYKTRLSLYPRLYQLYWEIESYIRHGNPSGHSLTQRFEYLKNASHVIKRHFWLGTGTGDVEDEIQLQYKLDKSELEAKWQLKAHNQLVTFFLTFGLIGFIVIAFSVFRAIQLEKNNIDFIALTFMLIVLFSMVNEDTFETQAGASFFAFFFALLIFGRKLSAD
jgi:O-antigen ligase